MQVFDIPLSAEQAYSQGIEDAIVRGSSSAGWRRLPRGGTIQRPKEAIPQAVEAATQQTISAAPSLQLPSSSKQLLRPEIKFSDSPISNCDTGANHLWKISGG